MNHNQGVVGEKSKNRKKKDRLKNNRKAKSKQYSNINKYLQLKK